MTDGGAFSGLSTVQEWQQQSTRHANLALCASLEREWAAAKQNLLKSLGCSHQDTPSSLGLNAHQHRHHELSFASHKP